jgi:uncharacterized protein (DUF427 family)
LIKRKRVKPGPGQESVWDYPRPPRVESVDAHIQVIFNGVVIADTRQAYRVLETSHPPVYYLPPVNIQMDALAPAAGRSFCEWKGMAFYYDILVKGKRARKAAWYYPGPTTGFEAIKDHVAFYASKMDTCFVDGERVRPQPGGFYGGWITDNITGPFKGEPGTMGW